MNYRVPIMVGILFVCMQAADLTLEQICIDNVKKREPVWEETYQKALAIVPVEQVKKLAYAKHSISTMVKKEDVNAFIADVQEAATHYPPGGEGKEFKRLPNISLHLIVKDGYFGKWKLYIKNCLDMNFHKAKLIDISQDNSIINVVWHEDSLILFSKSWDSSGFWGIFSGENRTFYAVPESDKNSVTNEVSGIAFHPQKPAILFSSTYEGNSIHMHDLKQKGAIIKAIPLLPHVNIHCMKAFAFDEYIPSSLVVIDADNTLSFIPLNTCKQELWESLATSELPRPMNTFSTLIMPHPSAQNCFMVMPDHWHSIKLDSQSLQDDLAFIKKREDTVTLPNN